MNNDNYNLGAIHEKVSQAHERIDKVDEEIGKLRESKHTLSNAVQNHEGMFSSYNIVIDGIKDSLSDLANNIKDQSTVTKENTEAITEFKTMGKTALFVVKICLILVGLLGSTIVSLVGYIGGKYLGWW